ncbi:MAG: DUF262 domain-containing HNH endonuclease family protein, partial [Gammaproteobacteria bacterium]|nr:DUF262 domain-containing HNH endonuclease family protein [Gammaproteobacteria bacterium]
LGDILSYQRQHIIPVFQRPYSWTMKNWRALWTDIQALIHEGDKSPEHFLGPMIIDHGDTGSYVPEKYLVIDGQQRLVTLSILLCTLRDIARKHEIEHFASSVDELMSFRTTEGKSERRVLPRESDRTVFELIVNSRSTSLYNSHLIVKAYKYFLGQVRKELRTGERDTFDYLNEMYKVIVARIKFVSITLEDQDDPTKIYESMNFKTKLLLVADLIRNYALMHLPASEMQDEFFHKEWEPFEQLFGENDNKQLNTKELEDFYYRYLIAKREYFAKRLVYSKFKDEYEDYVRNARRDIDGDEAQEKAKLEALRKLVEDQKRFATYYRRIVHPELEPCTRLRAAFERFDHLDAKTAIPLLMSVYERYFCQQHPQHISRDEFLRIMNAVESFILRRSILRLRTRGYGLDFAQAKDNCATLEQLWGHFDIKDWPSDNAIEEALIEFPLYQRERKKARLILQELEKSFGHKEQPDISDPSKIQTEHIMPRKEDISPAWQEMLGDNADEIHAKYLHTLGNLTLSGYNQELGAKSFQDKQTVYADIGSNLELNKYILKQDQWTEAEITERASHLTERFIEIWPRPETPKRAQS